MDEDKMGEYDTQSYLPPKEAYLYFPKNNEIFSISNDLKPKITRNIFHVPNFHEEENKKADSLRTVMNDFLVKNIKKFENTELLQKILGDKELLMRYLNYNNYDIYMTTNMLKLLQDLTNKFRVTGNIEYSDRLGHLLNYGFIYTLGRDKKFRPIVVIDFRRYDSKLIQLLEAREFIDLFIFYFNFVIDKMMLPGQVEQLNIILQVDGMDSSTFVSNFKDVIHVIQLMYPSTLHLLYVAAFKSTTESSFSLIESFILNYNKEKVVFITKKRFNVMFREISHEILKDFLEPLMKDNISMSSHGSNGSDSNISFFNKNRMKGRFLFPPNLNNDLIFDRDEEKKGLMKVDDYFLFMKDKGNREFYKYDEEVFSYNGRKLKLQKTKTYNSKDLILENFATFSQKIMKDNSDSQREKSSLDNQKEFELSKNVEPETFREKETSQMKPPESQITPQDYSKNEELSPKNEPQPKAVEPLKVEIDTNDNAPRDFEKNGSSAQLIIKPVRSNNKIITSSPKKKESNEKLESDGSKQHSWKKNLTIRISDVNDSTQNSKINLKNNNQIENLNTSPKRNNVDNTLIDTQGRGDACCKLSNNCLVF